jgi:hypothetical protein
VVRAKTAATIHGRRRFPEAAGDTIAGRGGCFGFGFVQNQARVADVVISSKRTTPKAQALQHGVHRVHGVAEQRLGYGGMEWRIRPGWRLGVGGERAQERRAGEPLAAGSSHGWSICASTKGCLAASVCSAERLRIPISARFARPSKKNLAIRPTHFATKPSGLGISPGIQSGTESSCRL